MAWPVTTLLYIFKLLFCTSITYICIIPWLSLLLFNSQYVSNGSNNNNQRSSSNYNMSNSSEPMHHLRLRQAKSTWKMTCFLFRKLTFIHFHNELTNRLSMIANLLKYTLSRYSRLQHSFFFSRRNTWILLSYDSACFSSTYWVVTLFARFLGWSTSNPRRTVRWYASNWSRDDKNILQWANCSKKIEFEIWPREKKAGANL